MNVRLAVPRPATQDLARELFESLSPLSLLLLGRIKHLGEGKKLHVSLPLYPGCTLENRSAGSEPTGNKSLGPFSQNYGCAVTVCFPVTTTTDSNKYAEAFSPLHLRKLRLHEYLFFSSCLIQFFRVGAGNLCDRVFGAYPEGCNQPHSC